MSLDSDQLRRLAHLARLAVEPSELDRLRGEIERVLGFVDRLAAANVDGVEPMAHPLGLGAALRDDIVTETDRSDALLALAPVSQGGFYLVPKVIE